jgi:ADP-heptose:LPS heptosyltransferase
MAPAGVLVYRPGAIGDFILALPALAALRAHFPDRPLTVIGPPAALPLATSTGLADHTLAADDARLTPLFAPHGAVPAELRASHAVVWAGPAGEPLAANLRAAGARVVHAPARPPAGAPTHVADHLLATLQPLGVAARPPALPRVTPSPAARAAGAAFLATAAGGEPAPRWVALHIGSGSPRKNWPADRFAAAAHALAAAGFRPLLVAGPAEADRLDALAAALAPLAPPVARDWPLDALAGLLVHCAGYLGADSGITHLAAAVGLPVVAVFGPTDPAHWAPRGPHVTLVQHAVPCQPCTWEAMWACGHQACLRDLGVEAVVAVARRCFRGSAARRG